MNQRVNPLQVNIPMATREAMIDASSIDMEKRRIKIVWTTGAVVRRRKWDWDEGIVEYDEELVVDAKAVRLERMQAGAPFLNAHNAYRLESVLGSIVPGTTVITDGRGEAEVQLTSAPDAEGIIHRILEKSVRFVSVGYNVHQYEVTKKDGQRDLWRAVDWEPMEVSAVPIPADAGSVIRGQGNGTDPVLHRCVLTGHVNNAARSAIEEGNDMTDKTQTGGAPLEVRSDPALTPAPTLVQTPAPAPQSRAADPAPALAPAPVDAAAIRAQSVEIMKLVARAKQPATMAEDMIGRGLTLDQVRAELFDKMASADDTTGRAVEPTYATVRGESANDIAYRDGMTEALMHRHNPRGVTLTDKGREFRSMTLMEMARDALQRRNVNTRGMNKMELAAEALYSRAGPGYHSTSDFPIILANVAGKTLRAAYETSTRTFTAWARQTSLPDFKQVTRVQMAGAPDLVKVPESGEFTYGTIGEGKEQYALSTFGRIIAITRQTLINDDLDAFTRIPAAYGAAAADLESDMVYAVLLTNAAMADTVALFHASHGNVGTAGPVSETALAEAYRAMGNQRGLEGRQIRVQPAYLLAPPGKRSVEARKQLAATTPNSTADVNAFAGKLTPIEEPRLINAGGVDPWFLVADPSRIDTVEYAYLDGASGVFTEQRIGFEVDGIEIKARHDFATKAIDFRGMYRNLGTA